jgi:transcriptional regulator with XRE-family HTH domain
LGETSAAAVAAAAAGENGNGQRRRRHRSLRAWRLAQIPRMTQQQAAEQFGLTQTQWNRYEKGRRRPTLELAKQLARGTGVALSQIVKMLVLIFPTVPT